MIPCLGIARAKGGSGASILIGDDGKDQIKGGAGGAILIGGVTNYHGSRLANALSLEELAAEWQSAGSYARRIAHIRKGVGVTGTIRLVWKKTVTDDGQANTLTGGAGQNWFFKGAKDKLVNKKAGERVN